MTTPAGRRSASVGTAAAAVVVLLPVAAVAAGVVAAGSAPWARAEAAGWVPLTVRTLVLLALTLAGTVVLGTGLAWLTTAYRFPGRRALSWLLVLPTAVPAYILGLVWSTQLSYAGPVQRAWRALPGDLPFPPVRTLPVAAAVLTLSLYPYVYLLARTAFAHQAATPYAAARALGLAPWQATRRVMLPLARPSIAAGAVLVGIETLSDFATVHYFGVDTLSVGIYRVWRGQFDRPAATVLALLVLLIALALLAAERALRGRARYSPDVARATPVEPERLTGVRAWAACGACATVLALAVVVPLLTLVRWSAVTPLQGPTGSFDVGFLRAAANSVVVAAQVALAVAAVALALVHLSRLDQRRSVRIGVQASLSGYAVPGPVLAIGALLVLAAAREVVVALGLPGGGLVTGSVAAVVVVYLVRFLALGFTSAEARMTNVPMSMTRAALALGARPARVLRSVHLPLAAPGLSVGLVLVMVDALKELPIVLLLRPFGFETLSVRVWQLANESRYELAGLPALTIVLIAAVPVVLLSRRVGVGDGVAAPAAAAPAPATPVGAGR